MEVSILCPTAAAPLPPVQWNYEELKTELTEALKGYKGRVYTKDTITDAKADRAKLNHVRDALDQRRKDVKNMYLDPYAAFEAQIKELTGMVVECSAEIDVQVKAYEQTEKEEKLQACKDIWGQWVKELDGRVKFDQINNPKWLNKGTSLDAVEEEIKTRLAQIRAGLSAIKNAAAPEDVDAVTADYLETLDLARALNRIEGIRKARAAREAFEKAKNDELHTDVVTAPQPVPQATRKDIVPPETYAAQAAPPTVYTLDFRVWVTEPQAAALKAFLQQNNIKYGKVPQ